jgi:hydrogenase-4 component B
MAILLVGILLIGLVPWFGLAAVSEPTALLLNLTGPSARPLIEFVPVALLESLTLVSAILMGVFAVLAGLRFALLPRCDRRHVTWGCGYTRPNTRMQYSGSSFSHPMTLVFGDLLRYLRRESLPEGPFPADGRLETHCVDTVEYSVFNALRVGERFVMAVLRRVPETSRASIGFGLAALILLVVIVVVR